MMSEETSDVTTIAPEIRSTRRYSTGQTPSSSVVDGKKGVPNYLRASTGSCHDLCKYGRRHETEMKPWKSGHRRRMIDGKPPEKIVTTDEVLPDRKDYLKAKPKPASDSKVRLMDPSRAGRPKTSASEKRTLGSNDVSKSKASSELTLSATPSRLSVPGRIVTGRVSPDFEVSKQVSVKVAERRMSGKSEMHSRAKAATAGPGPTTSSSKSPASLGPRSKDRKAAENVRISNRIRAKNALITSTSSVPTKSSAGTSARRKLWKPKTVIGQANQKIAKDYGIQRIVAEVPEKTLYVIDVESDKEVKNFEVSEIGVANELPESEENGIISERPPFPSPSLPAAESPPQQNSSPHEEAKEEGTEDSSIRNSRHEEEEDEEEGDYDDEDVEEEVGSEYCNGESETFSDSESGETLNKEEGVEELTSTGDSVGRWPREAVRVHPLGSDGKPVKLKFRRGRVVEIQSDDNTPRRLKFRRGKTLEEEDEDEARTRSQRRALKKREVRANPKDVSDTSSEKYALRRSGVQEKKEGQGGLFNNVIEETASKLVETRKSKVKALVGAFETVISLQDGKPSATNTSV